MIKNIKKATIIIPHPDDETIAAGGTLLLFKKYKIKVSALFISGHLPPLYKKKDYEITKNEAKKALRSYSISNHKFLDIPATKVNEVEHYKLNTDINA